MSNGDFVEINCEFVKWEYPKVVVGFTCPKRVWIKVVSLPDCKRCVVNECLNMWEWTFLFGFTFFFILFKEKPDFDNVHHSKLRIEGYSIVKPNIIF